MLTRRDHALGILLAIAGICVTVVLGWYDRITLIVGDQMALVLLGAVIVGLPVAAILIRWPHIVKVPLQITWYGIRYTYCYAKAMSLVWRIHHLIDMIQEIESTQEQKWQHIDHLAERADGLKSHIDEELVKIDERITHIDKNLEHLAHLTEAINNTKESAEKWWETLLTVFPWIVHIIGLQTADTRIDTLRRIHGIVDNCPSEVFTDEGLASVIRETGKDHLVNSPDEQERELARAIRRAAYRLDENDFRQTKMALRNSARRMLNHGDGSVNLSNVYAFEETTKHADQWPFGDLQSVVYRLRMIRQSGTIAGALRDGTIGIAPAFASTAKKDIGFKRVWKRVWAAEHEDDSGTWGRIRCMLDNGGYCTGGDLEEISLCGCTCLNCPLESHVRIFKCELFLPCYPDPITVRDAEFKNHDGSYLCKISGKRIAPGFSLEFKDMEPEDFGKLANYIRPRKELNPDRRPPNAPKKPAPTPV